MYKLVALDPGEATGWAAFGADDELLEYGEFTLWRGLTSLFYKLARDSGDEGVVVCERFALYGHKARSMTNNEFPSSQVIGVVRFLAEWNDATVCFQPASVIHSGGRLSPPLKPLVDAAGVTGDHARDAAAHGFWFLRYSRSHRKLEED